MLCDQGVQTTLRCRSHLDPLHREPWKQLQDCFLVFLASVQSWTRPLLFWLLELVTDTSLLQHKTAQSTEQDAVAATMLDSRDSTAGDCCTTGGLCVASWDATSVFYHPALRIDSLVSCWCCASSCSSQFCLASLVCCASDGTHTHVRCVRCFFVNVTAF